MLTDTSGPAAGTSRPAGEGRRASHGGLAGRCKEGAVAAPAGAAGGAAAGQEGGGESQADGGSEKRRVVNLNAKKK